MKKLILTLVAVGTLFTLQAQDNVDNWMHAAGTLQGFDRAEASLRARVLLSANVSPLLAQDAKSRGDFFRGCLRLLVADAPRAGAARR